MEGGDSNTNATDHPPLSLNQDSQNYSSFFHQDPNPHVIHPASSNNSNQYPLINNTPLQEVESRMRGLCLSSNNGMMLQSINNHNSGFVLWRLGVAVMAKHPTGCSYLQKNIDEGKDVDMILSQVKNLNNVYELMIHDIAYLLIQKIFKAETVTLDHKVSLFFIIICDKMELINVCKNQYGLRVIQNMLDSIIESPYMMYGFVYVIKSIAVELMKNNYGCNVIIHCVKLFPPICQEVILDEVARHCVHIATDKIGAIVITKCLNHADRVAMNLLVTEIVSNVTFLVEDGYGNYVLQYLIDMNLSRNEEIILKLRGSYVRLTKNKYASHVLELLLEHDNAGVIVEEIIESNELLSVLQDCYGNFVVQKALQYSQAYQYIKLKEKIIFYYDNLQSHPYGKMVLKKAHL